MCDTLRHVSFVPPSLSPASRPRTSPSLSYQVGDVIYIEANSGAVKRVGRCDAYATEFDLEAEEYVPLPKVRGRGAKGVGRGTKGVGGAV